MDRAISLSGLKFDYVVEFANITQKVHDVIPLLKLHGSLNWFYCDTCQHVYLLNIEQTVKGYLSDEMLYPVIGVCKECGGQRRGLLVPPLAMKFDLAPPLDPLRERAGQSFEKADLIVVVGFSFAEADFYLTRMLTKAMQNSQARLLIVDPDFVVVSKVKRRFGVRIPSFQDDRIMWCVGDCSEILPKFLSGAPLQPTSSPAGEKEVVGNGARAEIAS
jgi:NAD-dependent SIR2 family protein deacetylase